MWLVASAYLTMTCIWEEQCEDDDYKYGIPEYKEPIAIKCYKYDTGANKEFRIDEHGVINKPVKTYVINDIRVSEGDLLDNHTISAIRDIYDFSGKIVLRECIIN